MHLLLHLAASSCIGYSIGITPRKKLMQRDAHDGIGDGSSYVYGMFSCVAHYAKNLLNIVLFNP